MAYSEQVVHRARARLAQAKAQREAQQQERLAEAYEKYPRLREIDRQLRRLPAQAVSTCLAKGEDPTQAIEAIRAQSLALQSERQWIIDAGELEEGELEDEPICTQCGGSGYVGAQMCACLRELCRQEQKRELTSLFVTGKESFESFSLEKYTNQHDPELGTSPRHIMQRNLSVCKKYADRFNGTGNLLFTGATGLGKTFLSACIARQVADAGFSVVYETAGKVFSDFEAVKFGNGGEELTRKYFDCDLLIIDDLGTEMTSQFVISALYTLINTRLVRNRAAIVSTNLPPEALERRYSPQISSRLLGTYQLLLFAGSDIRLGQK